MATDLSDNVVPGDKVLFYYTIVEQMPRIVTAFSSLQPSNGLTVSIMAHFNKLDGGAREGLIKLATQELESKLSSYDPAVLPPRPPMTTRTALSEYLGTLARDQPAQLMKLWSLMMELGAAKKDDELRKADIPNLQQIKPANERLSDLLSFVDEARKAVGMKPDIDQAAASSSTSTSEDKEVVENKEKAPESDEAGLAFDLFNVLLGALLHLSMQFDTLNAPQGGHGHSHGHGGHGHSHGGKPCHGHGPAPQPQPQPIAAQGGHGHSHGGKPCHGHGPAPAVQQQQHGHSHGGKPCHGHGPAAQAQQHAHSHGSHGHSHGGKPCHGHGHGAAEPELSPEEKKKRDLALLAQAIRLADGPAPDAAIGTYCGGCKATDKALKKCARCQLQAYCSADCQKKDWPLHKIGCKKPAQ